MEFFGMASVRGGTVGGVTPRLLKWDAALQRASHVGVMRLVGWLAVCYLWLAQHSSKFV
jgi:hypothetical protein